MKQSDFFNRSFARGISYAMDETTQPQTWPDLAIGLYDKLTGRGAEITYEFEDFEISVPSAATTHPVHATWKIKGTMKIRTKDTAAKA